MAEARDSEDWRRERSLQALGRAMRGEEPAAARGSLLSAYPAQPAIEEEDAATRHRMARSRREASANPLLAALARTPDASEPKPAEVEDAAAPEPVEEPKSGMGRFMPFWLRSEEEPPRPSPLVEETPAPRSAKSRGEGAVANVDARPSPAQLQTPSADREPPPVEDQQWKPLIDPMKVVGGIMRSKLLIVALTILGALLGVAVALSTPKKYEAVAELIVDPRDLKLTDRDLTQSVIASDATLAIVENQVRVLTSGAVLNKVVDRLNLVNDPEFNGEGSGGLSVRSLIHSLLTRKDAAAGVDDGRRRALAINNLAEALSVNRGGKTFVITVGVTTQNGEKSALIANTMTDVFLQTYGEIQSDTATRATDELTARLDELRKGVEDAERKVEDYKAAHDLIDAQGRLISDDELLKLNDQLATARARTLELNARAASARSADVDSVLGGALPEEISSNAMADLRSQYSALKQEADRAAVRLGPRHPERLALEAQLAGARERIAAELRRIQSSLQVDLKRAVQLEQELASRLAQLKVRSGDVNKDLVSLRELEREANAKRAVYEAFLLRAKETGEQRDINTANINVISKAYAPLESSGPSRAMIALAGLFLGFASGIGLGAMRGTYDSLRDTAALRSRRQDWQAPSEPAEPPPAGPTAGTAVDRNPSRIGSVLAAARRTVAGKRGEQAEQPVGKDQTASEAQEPAMYPYPAQPYPHAPQPVQQPAPQYAAPAPQVWVAQPVVAAPPPGMYAPHYQPAPPHPYAAQPVVYTSQAWPQPPHPYPHYPVGPYAQPMPYPGQPVAYASPQPVAPSPSAPQAVAPDQQTPIEEIRASLREFRDAVRDLTESRSRRRYF